MRISISNIAWNLEDEPAIARLLRDNGVDRVDVAPGKYFPDPFAATDADIVGIRQMWARRGFAIEGMQSLLFGTSGLNLFSDGDDRMLDRLDAICRIGGKLGARSLTFGSPRNRDRTGLSDADSLVIATRFFRRLGDRAQAAGVIVCLEPNPAIYHCNFMITTAEAADMVRRVDHPAIALQLDIGAIALNGEDPAATIASVASLIGHVHASEPELATLGDRGAPHADAGHALREVRPDCVVTIEMAPTPEDRMTAVARAVSKAQTAYGDRA